MGQLPPSRVQPSKQFLTTGFGYAGPFSLRWGTTRSSKINNKGLYCYFLCFVIKAAHIDVTTSLTKEAFLTALRRFVARRGKPKTVYSDDGTNFQGASNQLHEVYNILQSSPQMAMVQDFLATVDVTGNSYHHMDLTLEDYGKQQ
jgi:hypothetical protein